MANRDRTLVAQGHDHQRAIQAAAPRGGQLREQGLPTRLQGSPAWTGSTNKASDFRPDE
jgi:hypothetical protein